MVVMTTMNRFIRTICGRHRIDPHAKQEQQQQQQQSSHCIPDLPDDVIRKILHGAGAAARLASKRLNDHNEETKRLEMFLSGIRRILTPSRPGTAIEATLRVNVGKTEEEIKFHIGGSDASIVDTSVSVRSTIIAFQTAIDDDKNPCADISINVCFARSGDDGVAEEAILEAGDVIQRCVKACRTPMFMSKNTATIGFHVEYTMKALPGTYYTVHLASFKRKMKL